MKRERPELRKPIQKPLTETEVVRYTKLLHERKVNGYIRKWRGNYYFIPDNNGSKEKVNN